jgi:hypothetical protein
MSVRTHKRLAALVIVLSLCIAAYPAHSQTQYNESGSSSTSVGDGRSGGLSTLGDPDRGTGCPPPSGTISKSSTGTGVVLVSGNKGMALREWLTRWLTGLLQRIGNGY